MSARKQVGLSATVLAAALIGGSAIHGGMIAAVSAPMVTQLGPIPGGGPGDNPGSSGSFYFGDLLFGPANLGPLDVTFSVIDNGAMYEWLISTTVFNDSGADWAGLRVEILTGAPANLDIDFGSSLLDPTTGDSDLQYLGLNKLQASQYTPMVVEWNNAVLVDSSSGPNPGMLALTLDVPDGGVGAYDFVVRYTPLVPEPTVSLLFVVGSMTTLLSRKLNARPT